MEVLSIFVNTQRRHWNHLLILAGVLVCCESTFSWNCSSPSDNVFHFPDIPATVAELESKRISLFTASNPNTAYIYQVLTHFNNCSGTVTGVEYCYQQENRVVNGSGVIFTLLIFDDFSSTTADSDINRIPIPAPSVANSSCSSTSTICCDSYSFMEEQFFFHSNNFIFGILTPNNGYKLYSFDHSLSLNVETIQVAESVLDSQLSDVVRMNQVPLSLRIMRLVVNSGPTTSAPDAITPNNLDSNSTAKPPGMTQTTVSTTTNISATTSDSGGADPTTINPTEKAPPLTTDPMNMSTVTSSAATSSQFQGEGDSTLPIAVGVVVGLAVSLVLLCVGVVVIVMCVRKNRGEDWKPEKIVSPDNTLRHDGFDNALYGNEAGVTVVGTSVKYTPKDIHDYASLEPSSVVNKETENHEYATADDLGSLRKPDVVPEYSYASTDGTRASQISREPPELPPSTGNRRSKSSISDAVYMAPARDEHSLYAQFSEIKITVLSHSAILLKEKLGAGQFGTVHKAEWRINDKRSQMVAVKTLNKGADDMDRVKFLQEAAIMGQFLHPNVVKLYGVATQEEPIMIVLELLSTGDLRNHLLKSKETNSESIDVHTMLSYCRQIASGMAYLSSKAFVHRDLAARNILVSEDGVCKIADFGMSRDLMDETYYISHGGKIPVRWTAPEAIHYKKYSTASDVWSFGCVMYEIWSLGHKPFESFSNHQTIVEIEEGYRLAPPPGTPRAVYKFMIECWHPVKSDRPTFTELMQELSLPDTKILKWTEEDKMVHPEASVLGAQLHYAEDLYPDLQNSYVVSNKNVASYEEPFQTFPK